MSRRTTTQRLKTPAEMAPRDQTERAEHKGPTTGQPPVGAQEVRVLLHRPSGNNSSGSERKRKGNTHWRMHQS